MIKTRAAVEQLVENIQEAESETWTILDDERNAVNGYFDGEGTRRKLLALKDRAQSLGFLNLRIQDILDSSEVDKFKPNKIQKVLKEKVEGRQDIKLIKLLMKCLKEEREPTHYELKDIFGA